MRLPFEKRVLTRTSIAVGLVLATAVAAGSQQTSLTPAQLKQAAFETPKLVELLGLRPGMSVADVGAGFGAWMHQLSAVVGPSGRVYATDVGAPQIEALRAWVARDKLANVTVIQGAVEHTNLPAGCCDAILMRDVYHHLTAPDAVVRSMAAALKPGGRLALIDFPPQTGSSLPAGVPESRGGHGVPADVVRREVSAVLTHVETITTWEAPNQQQALYLLLFRKP
jgi:ubiquinone/menaquinone biosynthesis C-methylase UbiE